MRDTKDIDDVTVAKKEKCKYLQTAGSSYDDTQGSFAYGT